MTATEAAVRKYLARSGMEGAQEFHGVPTADLSLNWSEIRKWCLDILLSCKMSVLPTEYVFSSSSLVIELPTGLGSGRICIIRP